MNNKGQSLVIFVAILPIIVLALAFFIDSSLCIMEKDKLDGVITSNMQEAINHDIKDIDLISKAINKNANIDIIVNIVNDDLKIQATGTKKSLFGKVFNFDYYNLKFNYCGNYINKKINKKCG